ncbi:unnamed protein product [Symbiodinium sp. CCMP2456]|nr:unnamed protein product [Symbiodinium sp. CCMP2456]
MAFSQLPRLSNQPPVSVLMYGMDDSGWQLNANLTALAPQSAAADWVKAQLSAAGIAMFYPVKPSPPLNVYSFAYDGTSWTFVNVETFPEGESCENRCLELGGNLMVFKPLAGSADRELQTFQWQGASWSLIPTANLTRPPGLGLRFAVDGQQLVLFTYTVKAFAFLARGMPLRHALEVLQESSPRRNFIFIYEQSAGFWAEVYRQEVGETDRAGSNFVDDVDISSSGKAIVVEVSADLRRVFLFERGADGIWGPTQTLVLNDPGTVGGTGVGIGGTDAVVTYFVPEVNGQRVNTTASGIIIGCNSTAPTTPVPSYRYSYYRRYRRFRRARCPKWCAAVRWWHWWCKRCKKA